MQRIYGIFCYINYKRLGDYSVYILFSLVPVVCPIGRLDLPVYTEGRAARPRRSACSIAAPRTYYAVIPE